jgi:hypothetical protein
VRAGVASLFILLFAFGSSSHAFAAEPAATQPSVGEPRAAPSPARPSPARRALGAGASVLPGALVHGSGHYVIGETDTAVNLLIAEGVGLGMLLGGGTVLVLTGASRYVVGPAAAVAALGTGLFGTSLAADIYGSVSADGGAADRVPRAPPKLESELGYRYVSDSLFPYRHFAVERLSLSLGPIRIEPSAWIDPAGKNARYRLEGGYRFLGLAPGERRAHEFDDRLELVLGLVHHRYPTQGFTRSGAEFALASRYDLAHLGQTLRGGFVEFGAGYGRARIDYDIRGIDVPADSDDVLLTRFGFGAIFRGNTYPGSQALLYYDHRHDDFAAGLVITGLGSGVVGHFGTELRWFFTPSFGILAQAEVGSALVSGLSVLYRHAESGVSAAKEPKP